MKISALLMLFMCLSKLGWSQKRFYVADLKNHVGETVRIVDSIYSGEVFQKSVMVLSLGDPKKSDQLTLIIYGRYVSNTTQDYLNVLQKGKISFTGLVLMSPKGPIVVLQDMSSLRTNWELKID